MRFFLLWLVLASATLAALQSMHPKTYDALQQIEAAIEKKEFDVAQALFSERFENLSNKRTYDLAFVYHTYGYFWIQNNRYENAIKAFEKALSYEVLDVQMQHSTHLTLAQLTLSLSRPKETLVWLALWHKEEKPNENSAQLAMYATIALEQYKDAYEWAQIMIQASQAPQASMYETKLSLELQLKYYAQAIQTLRHLIEHFPHQAFYYKQLAALYYQENDPVQATAILESAYIEGFLKEPSDWELLAYYWYEQGAVDKSQKLMQKAYENNTTNPNIRTFYVQLLLASKEHDRAIEVLKNNPTAKEAAQLAQLFAARFAWKEVARYAHHLEDPNAQLLYGIALHYLNKPQESQEIFKKLLTTTPKTAPAHLNAQAWLRHTQGM